MSDIETTLAERGSRYADFRDNAIVAQEIKDAFRRAPNWYKMPEYMREGMDMFASKFSRMLTGDFLYDDNIHDVIGYAKLMQDRMGQDREAMYSELAGPGGRVLSADDTLELSADMEEERTVQSDGSQVRDPAFLNDPLRASLARPAHGGYADPGSIRVGEQAPEAISPEGAAKAIEEDVDEAAPVLPIPAAPVSFFDPAERAADAPDVWRSFQGKVAWAYTSEGELAVHFDGITDKTDRAVLLKDMVTAGRVVLYEMREAETGGVFCLGAFEIPKH